MFPQPTKMTTQTLLDFDLGESSSDSDFVPGNEDSDDFSANEEKESDDGNDSSDDSNSNDSESSTEKTKNKIEIKPSGNTGISISQLLEQASKPKEMSDKIRMKLLATPICCACLGDRSDDTNEIVECDGCGVSVHEGCYGVSDSGSVSSTVSSCSTEPWFCEACKAGQTDPVCELCPNKGGIFKETDVGKWVHLVCALYVPGVAFGEVDQLSSVTLFEMPYSKWGAKTCSVCDDGRFARTGVCIGCDAGMCKTYFHVTCAQSNGLLSEAHSEEVDHADPFYAHCKIHSDKTLIKNRKRNYNAFKMKMEQNRLDEETNKLEKPTPEQQRIERKLKKHKNKYVTNKTIKNEPWVPTQKMPRLLTTSASACRRLIHKAGLMGIDTAALEFQETQMAALADVRKKWHIPPSFSVEFIGYYLDRIVRVKDLKTNLEVQLDLNKRLINDQQLLRDKYDEKIKSNQEMTSLNLSLKQQIEALHSDLQALCPNKQLPNVESIGRRSAIPSSVSQNPPARPMSVPTAAALKMGVGFPLNNLPGTKNDAGKVLSTQRQNNDALLNECGICKGCTNQHLLAKCDTCHFYYHLGCLNPPLTRHPKKSKLYGWQCSECDKSDESEADVTLPKGPRRSRARYSKDGVVPGEPLTDYKDYKRDRSSRDDDSDVLIIEQVLIESMKPIKNAEIKNNDVDPFDSVDEQNSTKKTNLVKKKKIFVPPKKATTPPPPPPPPPVEEIRYKTIALQIESLDISTIEKYKSGLMKTTEEDNFMSTNSANDESTPVRIKKKSKKAKRAEPSYYIENEILENSETALGNDPSTSGYLPQFTSELITDESLKELGHKQNRKRKKDKHKNRHSSDSEKSPSKEHKRKRKHKNHDMENPRDSEVPHPRIKIKFKAIPLPSGEASGNQQFMYFPSVCDDENPRPMEIIRSRPASVEIIEEEEEEQEEIEEISSIQVPTHSTPVVQAVRLSPKRTPKKIIRDSSLTKNVASNLNCDVCLLSGVPQNLVQCDECKKNYHFTCLEPPVKKSPKRRGYSWICADCDPTDRESN